MHEILEDFERYHKVTSILFEDDLFSNLNTKEIEILLYCGILNTDSVGFNILKYIFGEFADIEFVEIDNLRKLGLITKIQDKNAIAIDKLVLDAFRKYSARN